MWDVVGAKTDSKHYECFRTANPKAPRRWRRLMRYMLDPDDVDVTATTDWERYAKQYHKQLQANRQENSELDIIKILTTEVKWTLIWANDEIQKKLLAAIAYAGRLLSVCWMGNTTPR